MVACCEEDQRVPSLALKVSQEQLKEVLKVVARACKLLGRRFVQGVHGEGANFPPPPFGKIPPLNKHILFQDG